MSFDTLIEKIAEKHNPTVMGLDPVLDYIPEEMKKRAANEYGNTFKAAAEAILEFNKALIDSVADLIPAVKPQSAFYEMYGIEGLYRSRKDNRLREGSRSVRHSRRQAQRYRLDRRSVR